MLKLIPQGRKSQWHTTLHVSLAKAGQWRAPCDGAARASGGAIATEFRATNG